MNESVIDGGVCLTAPASSGLLKIRTLWAVTQSLLLTYQES